MKTSSYRQKQKKLKKEKTLKKPNGFEIILKTSLCSTVRLPSFNITPKPELEIHIYPSELSLYLKFVSQCILSPKGIIGSMSR